MIFEVEFSEQAEADLRGIYEYVAFDIGVKDNADSLIGRIENVVYDLEKYPKRGRPYDKEPWKSRGLRFKIVGNYNIYYLIDEENAIVHIIRIMYSGRNTDKELETTIVE